jgi:DNA-binding HxlR family transcriptional regulator
VKRYHEEVRSYNQYCGLAKALDIVGDRWTLLVVRELLIRPCRYGELQDSLPGIASNLLAARLRHLQDSGVVSYSEGRYALTDWGQHLAEPVAALIRWAAPLMTSQDAGDAFQSQWLSGAVELIFGGEDPRRPRFVAELRAGEQPVTMESAGGRIHFRQGPAAGPDLVLTGPPDQIIGVLAGRLSQAEAEKLGVSVLGNLEPLALLRRADWLQGPEVFAPRT